MQPIRFAALAAPLLLLGACAPDFNDRNQRAGAGVGAGALLGAAIGSASGDAGKGALLGGALGGVLGAITPAPDAGYRQGGYDRSGYGQGGYPQQQAAPYPAQGSDPRQGGWYDQYGRWHQGSPSGYGGYQPNYR
jgi:hypothetical protein